MGVEGVGISSWLSWKTLESRKKTGGKVDRVLVVEWWVGEREKGEERYGGGGEGSWLDRVV